MNTLIENSAVADADENPAEDLRAVAADLVTRIEIALAAHKSATAANVADESRLQSLSEDIARLELEADAEDLSALQAVAGRKMQRERLAKKFADDASTRLRDADAAASEITDSQVSELFWKIQAELKVQIVVAVRPFIGAGLKAEQFAQNSDAYLFLNKHANLWGSMFPMSERFRGLLPVLRAYVSGRPEWLFFPVALEPLAHAAAGEFDHHAPSSSGDGAASGGV